jgi:hypothetical protein
VKIARTNDWGRAIAQVGYPRIDATIDLEVIKALPQVQADPAQFEPAYLKRREDFQAKYRQLEPDDAPVHGSDITLKPLSVAGGTNLAGAEGLLALLDRSLIRALKTQPLMMGINEATTETHANRQWELQVAGIKAIQHLGESMWERQLTLALNLQGIQAEVQFRYAELRAAEEMRDEQVRQQRNQNAAFEYWMGWDSQQETAEEITEHDPDQPEPRAIPAGWTQVGPLTPPVAVGAGGGAGGGPGGTGGGQPAQDATGNDGEQADDTNVANPDAGAERSTEIVRITPAARAKAYLLLQAAEDEDLMNMMFDPKRRAAFFEISEEEAREQIETAKRLFREAGSSEPEAGAER